MKVITSLLKKKKNIVSILLILPLMLVSQSSLQAEDEVPEKVYTGISNAREIIQNISFNDMSNMPANYWAKDAIYEMAALEAVKGYGDKNFRPDKTLSKEEAIALLYRMMGREGDAQKAAEKLNEKRAGNQKKDQALAMWADGYLQLAADDGLITQADLQTAFQRFQPKPGTTKKFVRADPAQRQEVAYWAAKAMKLEPVYGQQVLFNSFNDWSQSDPVKIPYIEAVLQNKIMNGKPGGYFDPKGSVRRDQMAQILKNMEDVVFAQRLLEKRNGYVESIYQDRDEKLGGGIARKVIAVRGNDGKLYHIMTEISQEQLDKTNQEFEPGKTVTQEKELIVYKNGRPGTSDTIEEKDQLDYIVDADNNVKFIKAVPGSSAVKEVEAKIVGVDDVNSTITIQDNLGNIATYSVIKNAEILHNGKPITLSEVQKDRRASLLIKNKLVVKMEVKLAGAGGLDDDIFGIVEDNNPSLRYISLYDEEGLKDESRFRIYNYVPENVEVEKNHKKATMNDIEPGDTVHIILGEDGNVKELSGADNYEVAYGRIVFKEPSSLAVEYSDGTQQVLDVANDVIVILDRKVGTYDNLRDGDYVRMLLQKTPEMTRIKEITSQTYTQDISNVYKAELGSMDVSSGKVVLKHPEKLYKGQWERDAQVGFLALKVDDNVRIYDGGKQLDMEKANKLYIGRDVYVAAKRSFGNEEVAQMLTFRDPSSKEVVYDDTVSSVVSGSNVLTLGKIFDPIKFGDATIVVKDGQLITGRSLWPNDLVYVAANRDIDSGTVEAGVIMTVKKPDLNLFQVYRGKLGQIKANKDFTLETFSILKGVTWEYNGIPKTFIINYNTRIIGEDGVINVRDFTPYSEENYIGQNIYVVANETEALLISTAPYGAFNVRGEVVGMEAESTSDSGETAGTGKIKLIDASIYDKDNGQWNNKGSLELGVLTNTIVIKNGELVTADKIERGDLVRILKKDDTIEGDAYLILVEK